MYDQTRFHEKNVPRAKETITNWLLIILHILNYQILHISTYN